MRQADLHGQACRTSHICGRFVRSLNYCTQPQRGRAIRTGDAPQQIAAVSLSLGVIDISNRLTHYQEVRNRDCEFTKKLPLLVKVGISCCLVTLLKTLMQYSFWVQAWDLQKQLLRAVLASEDTSSPAGYLLLVQHQPVFTLGSGSSLEHLGFDPSSPPFPLFRTERGETHSIHQSKSSCAATGALYT